MEAQYAGRRSHKFWRRVNALPRMEQHALYSLGVALQNLEDFVLTQLENAEANRARVSKKKQP